LKIFDIVLKIWAPQKILRLPQ